MQKQNMGGLHLKLKKWASLFAVSALIVGMLAACGTDNNASNEKLGDPAIATRLKSA